jgi:cation diffusion facilitator family transporter
VNQERFKKSRRAVFLGLAVNLVLAALKFSAGWTGHSYALLADAVDSIADLFSSLVVWRGLVVAAAPADPEHPYGHGKAEPIAAAIVAGMLIVAAFSLMAQAGQAAFTPHTRPEKYTLLVLAASLVAKELLFRFVARQAAALDNLAVRAEAWHHRSDAFVSLAAAIGIALSLWGGPAFVAADKIAAIAAAAIIAWNGWNLMRPPLDELMDASPDRDFVARIKSTASLTHGVIRVEKCVVRKAGFQFFVDMHVEVDPFINVLAAHAIAHHVKDRVREEFPNVHDVLVHIEPARNQDSPSI